MTDQHPITPPRELISQWLDEYYDPTAPSGMAPGELTLHIANQAVSWGADQELEACCDVIYVYEGQPLLGGTAKWLRFDRRPNPPSLKEQALLVLDDCADSIGAAHENIIRRALEALDA